MTCHLSRTYLVSLWSYHVVNMQQFSNLQKKINFGVQPTPTYLCLRYNNMCFIQDGSLSSSVTMITWYRPFSYCIDQAELGAFTTKSGRKHYNPPPLTVMWMNFDSPNFPSLCSLSVIISFQTCSNKCILYVLLFHKCIKIKHKMVNMYGVFLWLVQSSSRWNTIHSHRNYHVQLLSVRVGEFCHPARSR